ncbi:hypothetical protein [Lentzea sp.]|uniref:hypothetical protein n=1 Tax=Lentzea sp. TaxID=56099 RepID=UPI002D01248E|nr:hypothetical protein [Lentzea sp.]HUQ56389.1 hypothetical protein [Lentzea sp.]
MNDELPLTDYDQLPLGDQRNAPRVSGAAGGSPVSPDHSPVGNTPLRHGVCNQTPARGRN